MSSTSAIGRCRKIAPKPHLLAVRGQIARRAGAFHAHEPSTVSAEDDLTTREIPNCAGPAKRTGLCAAQPRGRKNRRSAFDRLAIV
jgi:hypothetical protein